MKALERLYTGLFVRADDVATFFVQTRCLCIRVADVANISLVLLGVLQFVLGCQPILTLVRSEIPPF